MIPISRSFLIVVFSVLVAMLATTNVTLAQSTSSFTGHATFSDVAYSIEIEEQAITFSEYPLDTLISDQYAEQGIIFGGDNPFITSDGANPTSPVLSGSPQFEGTIEGNFVDPLDKEVPVAVESFTFDAIGSTRIEWFDPDGEKLEQRTNSIKGI